MRIPSRRIADMAGLCLLGLVLPPLLFAQGSAPGTAVDSHAFTSIGSAGIYAVIALIIKSLAETVLTGVQAHKQKIELNAIGKVTLDLANALANCEIIQGDLKDLQARFDELKADRDEQRKRAESYQESFQKARVELARVYGGSKDPPSEMGSEILYGNPPDKPR